ncbi:hypothetical protein BJV82DRAFT_664187 [Fennellomyces sp. T-0311]|nr:hypothetical protein BJV82DRAFT_664187 [Fennellomyces sp. T-0311]
MKRKAKESHDRPKKQKISNRLEDKSDTWIRLHHSSIESLTNGDYDAAIDSSLEAVKLLDTLKAMVLDTCASAYAMKGMFGSAMEAAEKMIECTPLTAAGYLRAGDTLALQGKHHDAIQLFNKGVQKVPQDDEQYASLTEHKAASEAQTDKRVDFFKSLPSEVTNIIIGKIREDSEVDFDAICMDVSKAWRNAIADCPAAWSNVWMTGYLPERAFFTLLPLAGRHIQKLCMDHLNEDQCPRLVKGVVDNQLRNLRDFRVQGWHNGRGPLLTLLKPLGTTLTKLEILADAVPHIPTLGSVLTICPRLEILCYCISGELTLFSEDTTSVPKECNISSLTLTSAFVSAGVLGEILPRCPRIQDLIVSKGEMTGLTTILDSCPQLKKLGFNTIIPSIPDIPVDDLPGIQQFGIYSSDLAESADICSILNRYQSTLQIIDIELQDMHSHLPDRWAGLRNFEGKNLKHLTYTGRTPSMNTIATAILRRCPVLQSVTLQHLSAEESTSLLCEALLAAPNLRTLTLSELWGVNIPDAMLFFNEHRAKGKASSLRKVCLDRCHDTSDEILETLGSIETLEQVEIINCPGMTEVGLCDLFFLLHGYKTLKTVHLQGMETVTDQVLPYLVDIISLREIALVDVPKVSGDAIEDLVDRMERLESVKIDCPQIGSRTKKWIQEKLDERKSRVVL